MKDKNIKKHPSAQSLNDDALEHIAGGWNELAYLPGGIRYELSWNEREKLKKNGLFVVESPLWGYYFVKDSSGKSVGFDKISEILGKPS